MHYQPYDGEEEFEPRVVPKPITKRDCFVAPTVPEISLIFEKPITRKLNDASAASSPARSASVVRVSDNNPISCNPNSYAAWKEQKYSGENTCASTTHALPLCDNSYSYTCASPSGVQNQASAQKRREQTETRDKHENVPSVNKNDRMYEKSVKFKCSDTRDSYKLETQTRLSSNKRPLSSASSAVQKTTTSDTISDTLKHAQHFQTPGHQHVHIPSYSTCNVDNNETVKTLLQLVNSQNEQIKNLQLQVDRLVRLQEENFRNKSMCLCSQPLANQVFRYPITCYDPALASSLAQSHNRGIKQNVASQSTSVVEKQDLENFGNNNNNNNKVETALLEQHATKAFVEQKVSIGVMTSFEFTVQNSPFLIDSEICEKNLEAHREGNNINRTNTVNLHDTAEPVNRYKNTFTRKPGAAQLENIVEDSESYLSSSLQQQSSTFNASSSVKESSKMYQHLSTDLNREETHKGIYTGIGKDVNVDNRVRTAKKRPNTSMNVACSPRASATCGKAHVVEQTNDYVRIDGKKSYETNIDRHSLRDVHSPATTDYYHNHRNKEYDATVRQRKDVGDSMILSGGDLKILERPPPTPEPSIHVEMQEYTSDDESDKLRHTSKIGWTFYNNVLGQVNEILQNSGVASDKDKDLNHDKTARNVEQENDTETRTALNTVKAATLEQLRRLGISLTDNTEHRESNGNKTLDFDSSFYPRLDHQANMTHATSVVNETNTSMHMKALALKYLSDEQLADIAWHKQESSSLKHLMLSNMQGTNMSLATMRYLERYQLLPGKNNVQAESTEQIFDKASSKHDFKLAAVNNSPALRRYPLVQTSGTTCPSRILDLSTLKRQPKLL
ncbi:uncharacterized protein LOC112452479 isoform X1 [Temnothorax curvispinosus]|uniref:Uncharacterized protein LOC112452479 isoform X1 n=1 Tax=Temnothorax curvispinosus TaxID=300111 RepID=A0A6J1PGE9_9HYME|nr:uncharacterized protein LOC112452479 isoform X1 [Temnothorax curvispinosus]